MRLLVYPSVMEIGGSQLNAIEAAARLSERGHDVVVFGPDGVLVPLVSDLGMEFVEAGNPDSWPMPRNGRQLRALVRERAVELVHGYEWGPALDLAFGVEAFGQAVTVTTVFSVGVPSVVPRHQPMIVANEEMLESQRSRRGATHLMEPPIDTRLNAPRDRTAARARFEIAEHEVLAVIACRLVDDNGKLPGVLVAVEVIERMALAGTPVHLLVAGDGDGLAQLRTRAAEANRRVGRHVVTVTGPLLDPSDAYDAADLVLGMGSSVMKGMAFAKPVIVQGENGFWRTLEESSLPGFIVEGWWGHGGRGAEDLEPALRRLVADPTLRVELGVFGRRLAVERFSLDAAADRLEEIYAEATASPPSRPTVLTELSRCAYEVAKFEAVQLGRRMVGPQFRSPPPLAESGPVR